MHQTNSRRAGFVVAAAAAACASLLAAAAAADDTAEFCPPGLRYLVGLKCMPELPATLNCVPEQLRRKLCELPDTGWARRQCRYQTGVAVRPDLIEEITGAAPSRLKLHHNMCLFCFERGFRLRMEHLQQEAFC